MDFNKFTTDELLEILPSSVGNHKIEYEDGYYCYIISEKGDDIQHLNLHNGGKDWCASYGVEGEFLCMNPNSEEPPYDNAFYYGNTPKESLIGLCEWCVAHDIKLNIKQ